MLKTFGAVFLVVTSAALAAYFTGCTPSTELGGADIPNAMPNTRVTGQPPSLLEAGFLVHFHWTGSDPDGNIRGFQWKLSNNGLDGISVQDTLTVDPATGDTLNPWYFTTATDTTFIVSADVPGFPSDLDLEERHQRSYQTHSLFVRAVDEENGVDPTPAFISFTATTLLPRISVDRPERLSNYQDAQRAPPTVTFGFSGNDPDFELGMPTKYRYIFKTSWHQNRYIRTEAEFIPLVDQLISFSDSSWSQWLPYPPEPEDRLISFPNQPARDGNDFPIIYLFAIQAMDTAGAVSVDRVYSRNVQNVYISESMSPFLTMHETFLGERTATGTNSTVTIDIAQGQLLEFSWAATADDYAGVIESFRYGWDLTDANDDEDPNWAVQPGNSDQHRRAPPTSFGTGTHTLTIQVVDNSSQMTRFVWILEVVPVPSPLVQSPLLLVDDVPDRTSLGWTGSNGLPLDQDQFRDEFWLNTLGSSGGVDGWNSGQDVVDVKVEQLTYRDIVEYRSIIWISRWAQNNFVWDSFKPEPGGDRKFIWLASYQESVGNLLLAGERVLNEFIEEVNWMVPWVFDTSEQAVVFGNQVYFVGFGTRELPDGTEILVGRERYPYRVAGISMLDQVKPRYNVYGAVGQGSTSSNARSSSCGGVKGLILDPDFKARYMPEGGVFPDTIYADAVIDWKDLSPGYRDSLLPWPWGSDELYDGNISERTTPWSSQICDDEPCVDPMFRMYSRFDWVDDIHLAAGDPDWPNYIYPSSEEIRTRCGHRLMNSATGRTRTTGHIVGFISHKMEENKPNRKGDVVWGFDPYRFNREDIQDAIHWILGEHFGLTMKP